MARSGPRSECFLVGSNVIRFGNWPRCVSRYFGGLDVFSFFSFQNLFGLYRFEDVWEGFLFFSFLSFFLFFFSLPFIPITYS